MLDPAVGLLGNLWNPGRSECNCLFDVPKFDRNRRNPARTELRLNLRAVVVDEATNPAAALNDALKPESKGKGEAGLVASSTTSNPKSKLEHNIRTKPKESRPKESMKPSVGSGTVSPVAKFSLSTCRRQSCN